MLAFVGEKEKSRSVAALIANFVCNSGNEVDFDAVGVAQLVRASGCGPEGRGFEPHHPPHKPKLVLIHTRNSFAWVGLQLPWVWLQTSILNST